MFTCGAAAGFATSAAAAADKPIKAFILAGQSNMQGHAVVDLTGKDYNDGKGTLAALLADPATRAAYAHLVNADGSWRVRDDVWMRYQPGDDPAQKKVRTGGLGLGFTPDAAAVRGQHLSPVPRFPHPPPSPRAAAAPLESSA